MCVCADSRVVSHIAGCVSGDQLSSQMNDLSVLGSLSRAFLITPSVFFIAPVNPGSCSRSLAALMRLAKHLQRALAAGRELTLASTYFCKSRPAALREALRSEKPAAFKRQFPAKRGGINLAGLRGRSGALGVIRNLVKTALVRVVGRQTASVRQGVCSRCWLRVINPHFQHADSKRTERREGICLIHKAYIGIYGRTNVTGRLLLWRMCVCVSPAAPRRLHRRQQQQQRRRLLPTTNYTPALSLQSLIRASDVSSRPCRPRIPLPSPASSRFSRRGESFLLPTRRPQKVNNAGWSLQPI